jgi:hypothetical protein
MIRASFCTAASAPAPSASTASSTSPVWAGQRRVDPVTGDAVARAAVPTSRRGSAAATPGSAGAGGAARGSDRARTWDEALRGRETTLDAWTTRAAEPSGSATRGCGRTTRDSCAGAAGALTGRAERTLSPLAVVADGGSATAAPDDGLWSGTAAAGLGSGTDGAATAAAGVEGTLGAAGAAAGAGAGAGATGAGTGAAGTAPRAGRNESGSR